MWRVVNQFESKRNNNDSLKGNSERSLLVTKFEQTLRPFEIQPLTAPKNRTVIAPQSLKFFQFATNYEKRTETLSIRYINKA